MRVTRGRAVGLLFAAALLAAWWGWHAAGAPPDLERWDAEIRAAAAEAGIDPDLLRALVAAESGGDPEATSHAGAVGLAQLMPPTAAEQAARLGIEDWDASRLTDGALNLRLGASYLAWLLEHFDGQVPFAIAAYNAGPTRVRRWREAAPDASARDVILREGFEETRRHLVKVLRFWKAYRERSQ